MPETTELGSSAAYPPPPLIQRFETLNMKDTHSFIRSYPVSSRKLSQSPLLGPNHLCWCPSLSLQSRGHGRNSDTTDSTHPACRKKPSKQESNRVKSVASTLGSKLHAAEGSLLQHIRWKFELEASFGGLSAFVCRPIPRAPVT